MATRHFCTYFNAAYIWKGLALYESLKSVFNNFCFHVMALDDKTYEFLSNIHETSLVVENWKNYETEKFLELKKERTFAEYCWTCGPTIIQHFLCDNHLSDITYLDSDLMFYSSFEPIYNEIGGNSIAITRHFSKMDAQSGKFCVQFVYFRNDDNGNAALNWWKGECINWCYARYEDGKFGDQKYLDEFPIRFNSVKIIENRGAGIASWNMALYEFVNQTSIKYQGNVFPLIFFHFHNVKMDIEDNVLVAKFYDKDYITSPFLIDTIYTPYINTIIKIQKEYFGLDVKGFIFKKNSLLKKLYFHLRYALRNNGIVKIIYYKFHRHEGKEKEKL